MALSIVPSQKVADQPPSVKPCVQSSVGPPGACMTPSSDWNTPPMSLRIGGRQALRDGLKLTRDKAPALFETHRAMLLHRLGRPVSRTGAIAGPAVPQIGEIEITDDRHRLRALRPPISIDRVGENDPALRRHLEEYPGHRPALAIRAAHLQNRRPAGAKILF